MLLYVRRRAGRTGLFSVSAAASIASSETVEVRHRNSDVGHGTATLVHIGVVPHPPAAASSVSRVVHVNASTLSPAWLECALVRGAVADLREGGDGGDQMRTD